MFDTILKKKRAVGLVLLSILLGLFLLFNRIDKLDTVREDLASVTSPEVECFQGFCIETEPESDLLSRWWDFSTTYLRLVALGMTFAFLVAGLTEAFLFPKPDGRWFSGRGIRGSLKGLIVGLPMSLCSACIAPVSAAFRRRGAGIDATVAITLGSSTLNLPALVMAALVFTPMLAGSRIVLSLVGALLLGPLVAMVVGQRARASGPVPVITESVERDTSPWSQALKEGFRDWIRASLKYLIRLGPVMVLAGFASGLAIQWVSPETVTTYLGDNVLGIAIAATLGILINVPLLFEIPLVAALLLVGMGTAPAVTLLFVAAAGGPITFWGLAKVMPKKTVVTFATATWGLGLVGGLSVLALGPLLPQVDIGLQPNVASSRGEGSNVNVSAEVAPPQSSVSLPSSLDNGNSLVLGSRRSPSGISSVGATEPAATEPALSCLRELIGGTASQELISEQRRPTQEELSSFYLCGLSRLATTISFTDVAESAGVDFHHFREKGELQFGGGVAVGDYNGDGLLDIYLLNSTGANALYRNNGDGSFTDMAGVAGVDDPTGRGSGAAWGDYDNDGDLDLFVTNVGTSKLFRNVGDGSFTDVTGEAGVGDPSPEYRSQGSTWGDYDQDGFLDLLVVRHFSEHDPSTYATFDFSDVVRPLALYRNNGDGSFTNVTALLGNVDVYPSNVTGAGFKPSFIDYDNDGDADIYVVNDFGDKLYPNVLWRNDGPDVAGGQVFTDVSAASGADAPINSAMGLAVGDYDNDGDFDFYISNIGDSLFLQNQGDGTFVDTTDETGTNRGTIEAARHVALTASSLSIGWGTVFADLDNDGLLDLYYVAGYFDVDPMRIPKDQPNSVLVNNGDGTFLDVSAVSGADDPEIGREVAYADFNRDGLLDLFVVNVGKLNGSPGIARLFMNTSENANHWLNIKLIGTASNRDGIGARIKVTIGGVTQMRQMGASQGLLSHSVVPVHFGLGTATSVDVVEIRWPSGIVQTLTEVPADQTLEVVEP